MGGPGENYLRLASSLAAALLGSLFEHPEVILAQAPYRKFQLYCGHQPSFSAACYRESGGPTVKTGYRLLLVDRDGVLVSEFQLTENALAQPEAFVAALQESIESVEEEEL